MRTVNDLAVGQSAFIGKVDLVTPHAPRLLEMGFVPGTTVSLLARAPLGEPLILQVRGHMLLLRRDEAQSIFLKAEEPV